MPSGLIATSESRLDSIIDRADPNACLCSVTSLTMADAPVIAPSLSRIGETVSEIGNTVPSFRTRVVSRRSTGWPALILAMMAIDSPARSWGFVTPTDWPTISSLE